MSKKKTGLIIALGAALGAAAAGISYYLKYRSFHDELDKDFHDYEDDLVPETDNEEVKLCPEKDNKEAAVPERSYITLDPGKCKADASETSDEAEAVEDCEPSDNNADTENTETKKDSAVTVEDDTDGTDA